MNEQEMTKAFIEELAASYRHIAVNCERDEETGHLALYAADLADEADRLSAPQPDKFEGVKYVVMGTGGLGRLATRDDWLKANPTCGEPLGHIFLQYADGSVVCYLPDELTPWRPEVGEKVWTPDHGAGEVLCGHNAHWVGSVCVKSGDHALKTYPLSELRPLSFAPPEPEPEPEFEAGQVYARIEGRDVGIAHYEGDHWWLWLLGGGSVGPYPPTMPDYFRLATDEDIAKHLQLRTAGDLATALVPALRAHARQLAKEAK